MGVLQNIPVDPLVRRGLEEHNTDPLFTGLTAWSLAIGELLISYVLSMMPGWNTESYTRLVYHYLLKTNIRGVVTSRDEAKMMAEDERRRQELLKADEINEDVEEGAGGILEPSEDWADNEIVRERKHHQNSLNSQARDEMRQEIDDQDKVKTD